jgi:hypothetical protein
MKIWRWIVLLASTAAYAAPDKSDPVIWAWTCASKGFYQTKVLPDGRYEPIFDNRSGGPIVIKLRRDAQGSFDFCATNHINSDYVEISEDLDLFSTVGDPCTQIINWRYRLNPTTKKCGGSGFLDNGIS